MEASLGGKEMKTAHRGQLLTTKMPGMRNKWKHRVEKVLIREKSWMLEWVCMLIVEIQ